MPNLNELLLFKNNTASFKENVFYQSSACDHIITKASEVTLKSLKYRREREDFLFSHLCSK